MPLSVLERCAYLSNQIKRLNPNAQTEVEPYGFSSCLVTFEDKKLVEELKSAGMSTGGWSTKGSAYIDLERQATMVETGRITESDIPINLQKCTAVGKTNVEEIDLGDLSKTCRVYEVHVHNGKGYPSVHLRIYCRDSENETLNHFAEVVMQSHKIGRAICEGRVGHEIEEFTLVS